MSGSTRTSFYLFYRSLALSAKHASLNCLFNDAQRIQWWPADFVYLELQKPNKHAFSVSVSCVFVVCQSSVIWFGRCAETASLLSAKETTQHLIVDLRLVYLAPSKQFEAHVDWTKYKC